MDPVTTTLLALQAAAGIGKTAYGGYQAAAGRKALENAYEAPTGKPSEYAEMLKQARASDLAKRRLDEINRSMATSTAALQQTGARGVIGGIGSVTEAGSRAKTDVLSQQQAEIMRALQYNIQGAETERARQIQEETRQRREAQAAITAGYQNIAGGIGEIGSALATTIDARTDGGTGSGGGKKETEKSELSFKPKVSLPDQGGSSQMMSDEEIAKLYEELYSNYKQTFEKGGVQKTPGAFSHKKNPIDIMQDGAKIGEMTGGEYIFNPSQAKQLQSLAKSGSSPLHKFVKSLLNKPQFK